MTVDDPADPADPADPPTSAIDGGERAELAWLRAENALLRTERDVLVRVASEFAEDARATILHRTTRDIRTPHDLVRSTAGDDTRNDDEHHGYTSVADR